MAVPHNTVLTPEITRNSVNSGHRVSDLIGNTPLLRLDRFTADFPAVEFLAKAEFFNPGGSVKDRTALNIILEAEQTGLLWPGRTLLDATSGNTGIAYSMLAAAKGFRVKLCLPDSASIERKRILRAYGADLVITPADEGSDGAIRRARSIFAAEPSAYFYADQYNNPANWRAHYQTTAEEIWSQTRGRITHFIAGLGTSGTFTGVSRRLRELNPRIQCISLQPDGPLHGIEGWKHMDSAIVPGIYEPSLADQNLHVRTEAAQQVTKRLAREEGLLVSPSAGAALAGCLAFAESLEPGEPAVIVTIFADAGDKYLSERFWDED